jgi:hypothetical protein
MKRVALNSLSILSVGYSSSQKILEVEFPNKRVYRYYGIPKFIYFSLLKAESISSFFNSFIRGKRYPFREVNRRLA